MKSIAGYATSESSSSDSSDVESKNAIGRENEAVASAKEEMKTEEPTAEHKETAGAPKEFKDGTPTKVKGK